MKPFHGIAFCLVLVSSGACGSSMAERVSARGANDLECRNVIARSTGLGGWQVRGCARQVSYVCARGVCTAQGEISTITESTSAAAPTERAWSIEGWACRYYGATPADVSAANVALGPRSTSIVSCGASSFVASVGPTIGAFQLMEVDGDRTCAHAAIARLNLTALEPAGFTMRCDRE